MTRNGALAVDRNRVGTKGFPQATVEMFLQRRHQEKQKAFECWRRCMGTVLEVAIGQCERQNLAAPANMAPSDLRPHDLVAELIQQVQVTHNFEVRSPRNNQHALEMLHALRHFYLPYADVDDPAKRR
jgi:hypothetical protein